MKILNASTENFDATRPIDQQNTYEAEDSVELGENGTKILKQNTDYEQTSRYKNDQILNQSIDSLTRQARECSRFSKGF